MDIRSRGRCTSQLVRWQAETALIFARLAGVYLGGGLLGPAARLQTKAERLHEGLLHDMRKLTYADADAIEPIITELEMQLNQLVESAKERKNVGFYIN